MRRGDVVTIALPGDCGKPRPALVIQANLFQAHTSVTVLLLTSTLIDAPILRVTIAPNAANGLHKPSQVMIDKIMTVKHDRVGAAVGYIDIDTLIEIERCLAVFLGIAK